MIRNYVSKIKKLKNFYPTAESISKDLDKKTGKRKIIEVWGLTLCKNKKCSQIHNRDKNSALNMYKIVKSIYEGKGRPKIYCRETNKQLIPS